MFDFLGNFVGTSFSVKLKTLHEEILRSKLKRKKISTKLKNLRIKMTVFSLIIFLIVLSLFISHILEIDNPNHIIIGVIVLLSVAMILCSTKLIRGHYCSQIEQLNVRINERMAEKKEILNQLKRTKPYDEVKPLLDQYEPDGIDNEGTEALIA